MTYGNGIGRTKTYDLDRRLTAITQTGVSGIQKLGYAYNANDAITTLTNSVNTTLSQSFGYDDSITIKRRGLGTTSIGISTRWSEGSCSLIRLGLEAA